MIVLVGGLFLVCFYATLTLHVAAPESDWYKTVQVITLALIPPLGIALAISARGFFGERRTSDRRLIYEVRTHRAETRLLRSHVASLEESILSGPSPSGDQNVMRETKLRPDGYRSGNPGSVVVDQKQVEVLVNNVIKELNRLGGDRRISHELSTLTKTLNAHEAERSNELRELGELYNVKFRQVVAILDAQRVLIEQLRGSLEKSV